MLSGGGLLFSHDAETQGARSESASVDRRDVVLNADWLAMAPDARSRSSACRGEAQQGRLTRGLKEWSGDLAEVELKRMGEREREQLHK